MKPYKILWTLNAYSDLNKIYNYYNDICLEPKTATRLTSGILKTISSLSYFPKRYSKTNYKSYNLHKLVFLKYIIIYSIDDYTHEVFILHIFHGNQDYFKYL